MSKGPAYLEFKYELGRVYAKSSTDNEDGWVLLIDVFGNATKSSEKYKPSDVEHAMYLWAMKKVTIMQEENKKKAEAHKTIDDATDALLEKESKDLFVVTFNGKECTYKYSPHGHVYNVETKYIVIREDGTVGRGIEDFPACFLGNLYEFWESRRNSLPKLTLCTWDAERRVLILPPTVDTKQFVELICELKDFQDWYAGFLTSEEQKDAD